MRIESLEQPSLPCLYLIDVLVEFLEFEELFEATRKIADEASFVGVAPSYFLVFFDIRIDD